MNAAQKEEVPPPDWRAVRIDETQYCDAEWLEKFGIKTLYSVYLVDFASVTRCCEITPSYALNFIGNVPDEGSVPDDEEERDALFYELRDVDSGADPVTYMHCRVLDRMLDDENQSKIDIDIDDWEDDEERGFEDVREYYVGNPTW